jgi:group I intron endonuclease
MSCVYVHITPNGKLYIGMSSFNNPVKRWKSCGYGYQNQSLFWKAIQKYGWDNIQHIVLLEGLSKEVACECEKYLIDKYQTQNPKYGYNLSSGGEVNRGYHHTEEYKKHLSEVTKEKFKHTKSPMYGKTLSTKTKQQISTSLTGKVQSTETKLKRSQSLKGHVVSEETRKKISEGNKGKVRTVEQRKRLSEMAKGRRLGCTGYWKGKKFSDETREKMRNSHLGKPKSEETKRKLREAYLRRKEESLKCSTSV